MSQAGFTPISLYYSTTAAAAPSAVNLTNGELALNITDGKLFYKDNGGSVQVLATAAGASGDVVGPGSSTDNALVRFDGTTGKLVQSSVGVLSDAGVLTGLTGLTSSGSITFSGLTSGRLTYAGTGGLLQDSANLTFDGTTLSVASSNNATSLYFANSSVNKTDNTTQLFERTYTPTGTSSIYSVGNIVFKGKDNGGTVHQLADILVTGTAFSSFPTRAYGILSLNAYDYTGVVGASLQISNGYAQLDPDGAGSYFTWNNASFTPPTNGAQNLGSTTQNWKNFYASGAVTLSGGTANGVGYLNGSKVLTTGSALTFDGSTLGVAGDITSSGSPILYSYNGGSAGSVRAGIQLVGTDPSIRSYISGTEQMRLTSTGLGIGTSSPTNKLTVNSGASTTTAQFTSTGSSVFLGLTNSGASAFIGADVTGAFVVQTPGSGYSTKLLIDSTGNLGLGVTPSAWNAGKAFEIGGVGAALWNANNAGDIFLTSNTIYNSGFKYAATNAASMYEQNAGVHKWYTAPSGTAGNAISFTQAMTLDASGGFVVGATTAGSSDTTSFSFAPGVKGIDVNHITGSSSGSLYARFNYANGTIGSITQASTTGVLYNVTSDYRLKDINGPVTTSGAFIDSLKPVQGSWKADGSRFIGFLAHELQEASETVVGTGVKDGEEMQSIDYSNAELIANLVAELQDLRKRLAAAGI